MKREIDRIVLLCQRTRGFQREISKNKYVASGQQESKLEKISVCSNVQTLATQYLLPHTCMISSA